MRRRICQCDNALLTSVRRPRARFARSRERASIAFRAVTPVLYSLSLTSARRLFPLSGSNKNIARAPSANPPSIQAAEEPIEESRYIYFSFQGSREGSARSPDLRPPIETEPRAGRSLCRCSPATAFCWPRPAALSPISSKVTMPSFCTPETLRHAIHCSGICSVISAPHFFSEPPTTPPMFGAEQSPFQLDPL